MNKITSLKELKEAAKHQDRAVEVQLKATKKKDVLEKDLTLDTYKGIWNTTQNRIANVVSNQYQIIQHKDVLKNVSDCLEELNIDVEGTVRPFRESIYADLTFKGDKEVLIEDDEKGIRLGMRIVNSYDKTSSFRLEMYGYRLICENGMVLGKVLNDVRSVTFHIGQKKTQEVIRNTVKTFVAEMIESSKVLQTYVREAMTDKIEKALVLNLLEKLFIHKKHCDAIGVELKGKLIDRWVLYNAVTSYVTHGELSFWRELAFQRVAQKILSSNWEELLQENKVSTQG